MRRKEAEQLVAAAYEKRAAWTPEEIAALKSVATQALVGSGVGAGLGAGAGLFASEFVGSGPETDPELAKIKRKRRRQSSVLGGAVLGSLGGLGLAGLNMAGTNVNDNASRSAKETADAGKKFIADVSAQAGKLKDKAVDAATTTYDRNLDYWSKAPWLSGSGSLFLGATALSPLTVLGMPSRISNRMSGAAPLDWKTIANADKEFIRLTEEEGKKLEAKALKARIRTRTLVKGKQELNNRLAALNVVPRRARRDPRFRAHREKLLLGIERIDKKINALKFSPQDQRTLGSWTKTLAKAKDVAKANTDLSRLGRSTQNLALQRFLHKPTRIRGIRRGHGLAGLAALAGSGLLYNAIKGASIKEPEEGMEKTAAIPWAKIRKLLGRAGAEVGELGFKGLDAFYGVVDSASGNNFKMINNPRFRQVNSVIPDNYFSGRY